VERRAELAEIDPIIRWHPVVLDLRKQSPPIRHALAHRYDTTISFTGVRKQLPLGIVDSQQPLATPDFGESDGFSLAVVKDMGNFVDNIIRESPLSK
jgi:hypothetical protein